MTRLHLRLFGAFQAEWNGAPVRFAYAKQAALLAYLGMTHTQPSTRRTLGLLLWPDKPADAVQVNLRKVISSLRKVLEAAGAPGSLLQADPECVQLSADLDLWRDVTEFEAHLADCAGHRHRHAVNCPACHAAQRQACDLYRGDFLADLVLEDSDTFDAWSITWREALRLQALAACQALAEYNLQRGRLLAAQSEAQRLLRIDPLHEEGNQLLIAALAALGQRGLALAHYEQFRRHLGRELGATPSTPTEQMAATLRQGQMPAYTRTGGSNPYPSLRSEAPSLNPLIGRAVEVDELNAWLNDPDRRLITITGLGGAGKTHLAAAVAHEQNAAFAAGAIFVSLAAVEDVAEFTETICRVIVGRVQPGISSLAQVTAHIGTKDMLLVLDHFEHLLDARADLTQLLNHCPNLVILVTSRLRLGLAGEWVFRLGGLGSPPEGMEGSLTAYSAAELFLHAARQAQPDLVLDTPTATAIGEICRLVQGLPLALVLLATWVRVLPCHELLQELRQSIDLVRSTYPTDDDKATSLRSVFEQSWQRLRDEERKVLAALAVFSGTLDRQAAAAVAGADLDILSRLVDHSWLHVASDGRYGWHELVRQFCAEQLAHAGAYEAAAHHHFTYYLAQAEANAAELADFSNLAAFLWFGRERANLQAAAAWAAGPQVLVSAADRQRLNAAVARAGHRWGVHLESVSLYNVSTVGRAPTRPIPPADPGA